MTLLSSTVQKGQDGLIVSKDQKINEIKSAFSGVIKVPGPSPKALSDWTMHIWFEANIEKVDFTIVNAAVAQQKDRIVFTSSFVLIILSMSYRLVYDIAYII